MDGTFDLGHNLLLRLQDEDNPMLEFVTSKGTHGALNLKVLADSRAGTIVGKAIHEWLADRQKEMGGE